MLELNHVSRVYRGKTAVDDVSLTLEDGKTCLLLGPNGSGKTTMMKMIAGLVAPTGGEIRFGGEKIGTHTKAQIAYMPTENYFYNYMNVRDAGRYYRDFFADFDMGHFEQTALRAELPLDARVRTLSSGMAAKLRLALTLSRDAGFMMFDEPINGVDLITRDWVISEIAARRSAGRTMLISTHLVEQAEAIADTVVYLKNGKLVRAGAMAEVCAEKSPEDLYREIYGAQGAQDAQGGTETC